MGQNQTYLQNSCTVLIHWVQWTICEKKFRFLENFQISNFLMKNRNQWNKLLRYFMRLHINFFRLIMIAWQFCQDVLLKILISILVGAREQFEKIMKNNDFGPKNLSNCFKLLPTYFYSQSTFFVEKNDKNHKRSL